MGWRNRVFPEAGDFHDFMPPDDDLPIRALPFIWIFVKALRVSMTFNFACAIAGSSLASVEPYFFGKFVTALTVSPAATARVVITYILLCQFLVRIVWQMAHAAQARSAPVLAMLVRHRLARYLYTHSYRYFQDDFAGRLAGKVVEMPQAVRETISDMRGIVVPAAVHAIVATTLFLGIDWRFGLCASFYFISTGLLICWRVTELSRKAGLTAAASQTMRGRYLDGIGNILLVKLFARERHENRLFSAAMIEEGRAEQNEQWQTLILWRGQHVLNASLQIGIILLCLRLFYAQRISIGDIATALTLGVSITMDNWWLLVTSTKFFSRFALIEEALATIVQPVEIRDAPNAIPLPTGSPDLSFEGIVFAYPGRSVFDGFTLNIPQGQKVGLIGPSGAGKSTLMQLTLRLFDVQGGAIRIGGQDIREVPQSELRGAIAVIPQTTDLLHRSIRDNIRYGRLDATDEEIVAAAKKAFIHETILSLRDQLGNSGYDCSVGERGVKLSGGQKQRIAIARAFLKDAPILILDEATSALDSESEELIQRSFTELFRDRTVIVIAHRLSTIAHLDRIVVLEGGRIAEDGPHQALLEQGALYARLWSLQSAGFLPVGNDFSCGLVTAGSRL